MTFRVEMEQEEGGRWIAEVVDLPMGEVQPAKSGGVLAGPDDSRRDPDVFLGETR